MQVKRFPRPPSFELADCAILIDGEAIVIDKPAGLDVNTPRSGAISVESLLSHLVFGFKRLPSIVHRLDRDTSGCLLLARNPKAHQRFAKAFEEGLVEKTYHAVLDGVPPEESGRVELALSKRSSAESGWRMVGDPHGKSAATNWRVLNVAQGRALVEFRPETGRTHQLRVHAREGLGLSIVGDPVYGRDHPSGMMLHASRLIVPRGTKPAIEAVAPLPERFAALGFAA